MGIRHVSEPRRLMIRTVLALIAAAWLVVFIRAGISSTPPMGLDKGRAPSR